MTEGDATAAGPAQLVSVVRAWRHGAVNRLQVALGWLQLGRPEQAATALAEWCRQLEWEGAALRCWPVEAASFYLVWRARCEEMGLEVAWRAPVPGSAPGAAAGRARGGRGLGRPAASDASSSPESTPPGPGQGNAAAAVGPALEAALEAARREPGRRIWLQWDGRDGRLRWGLEGGGPPAATGSRGSTTG
ncbi:hypothetical protein DYI95_010980 [Thermaerobacter sp. PB12/4term]|uniref:Spo0B domain-containing protein n=1 Tax=Thermaerobacter sp. PB12/4term TaxID=2293838 RepID=UPI000E3250E8|nr:Spo0B domain-containing protein [Thermaerobacter sp. PB12/4term]QIA27964.1 hypothetical protein DYI95_010980 [Thermaerobacter sp. PB12/4term]